MKVFVNHIELDLFESATVFDAVRAYYSEKGEKMPVKLPDISDQYGNSVALDGTLSNNSKLLVGQQ